MLKNRNMAQRNFNTNLTGEERGRIGELIKALRGASGISQKDLAFKVGVSPARISQIEKGTLDYRIDTLIACPKCSAISRAWVIDQFC
jgi:DNA-binding XRE family transcriptional regulator